MKIIQLLRQAFAVAGFAVLYAPAHNLRADDVNNLIKTILEASPETKTKLINHTKNTETKAKDLVPELQIPENLKFEATSKLPKDCRGKYIYGIVKINYISTSDEDFYMTFVSPKNNRGFAFETKNMDVIKKLRLYKVGDLLTIPEKFPLEIYNKTFTGAYWLKIPYE
jgi:hypothetical protein